MLGHNAHSIDMANKYHMNNDNCLLANSHKNEKNLMMKRAYQLSGQIGQW